MSGGVPFHAVDVALGRPRLGPKDSASLVDHVLMATAGALTCSMINLAADRSTLKALSLVFGSNNTAMVRTTLYRGTPVAPRYALAPLLDIVCPAQDR